MSKLNRRRFTLDSAINLFIALICYEESYSVEKLSSFSKNTSALAKDKQSCREIDKNDIESALGHFFAKIEKDAKANLETK